MAKLNKANNNGSISVILPKNVTDNIWNVGDDVEIEGIGTDTILISRDKPSILEWDKLNKDLKEGIDLQANLYNSHREVGYGAMLIEPAYRKGLKQFLINMVKRI